MINDASAYDKMPGIGPHPKGIHYWWARLPLPTARAILFASVVDDPSAHPERFPTDADQERERERLFDIIRRMMQKKLHEHPEAYAEAHEEMLKHCDGKLPPVLDPFAGGGSIPLEASRLGFEAHACDLNPVAVLLNKCNLEIAPRWANHPPVNPEDRGKIGGGQNWTGTKGLAADLRYYAGKIREEAQKKIGHLYPKVAAVQEKDGSYRHATPAEIKNQKSKVQNLNVIAWIWARTVASDNAAARNAHVPLVSTYWLSSAKGKLSWLEPVVDKPNRTYRFEVRIGEPADRNAIRAGTKLGRGGFKCLLNDTPIPFEHIRREGIAGRLGMRLLALVAEIKRGRIYLPATTEQEEAAAVIAPDGELDTDLPSSALGFRVQNYGIHKHRQMFAPRQLMTLLTLSDLVKATHSPTMADTREAGLSHKDATAYADTVTTFLALMVDRCADFNNALCGWSSANQKVMHLFGRGAVPMIWDFSEANTLGESVGAWKTCSDYTAECIEVVGAGNIPSGHAAQTDAADDTTGSLDLMVSTDPPYYDNIGYAALSDFFYVWLRRTIGQLYPDLFKTVLTPKIPELTASPERFDGDLGKAKEHFESGFRTTFTALRDRLDPRFPLTVYYAFKQEDELGNAGVPPAEEDDETPAIQNAGGTPALPGVDLTTGWETLLEALVSSGFQITGTWPVRASQAWRMRAMGANALASYIVLACRPRPESAAAVGRREFLAELKRELTVALRLLQQGNVAPVDFAQAAIGSGMAVYSRYSRVIESNGQPMSVRTALGLINQIKEDVLGESVEEFDADTRWAVAWFDQNGFAEADYGDAELLAKAQAVSVSGLQDAGILRAKAGKVHILRPDELPKNWDPSSDARLTVWEMTHHLLRVYYHEKVGDATTAELLRKLGSKGQVARDLAYRLFSLCERRKRSKEAQEYNALVLGWPELDRLAQREIEPAAPEQSQLL